MYRLLIAVGLLTMTACCKRPDDRGAKVVQSEPYGQCVLPLLLVEEPEFSKEPIGLMDCHTDLEGSACCAYGPRADGCVLLMCRSSCNTPWQPQKELCP